MFISKAELSSKVDTLFDLVSDLRYENILLRKRLDDIEKRTPAPKEKVVIGRTDEKAADAAIRMYIKKGYVLKSKRRVDGGYKIVMQLGDE